MKLRTLFYAFVIAVATKPWPTYAWWHSVADVLTITWLLYLLVEKND